MANRVGLALHESTRLRSSSYRYSDASCRCSVIVASGSLLQVGFDKHP